MVLYPLRKETVNYLVTLDSLQKVANEVSVSYTTNHVNCTDSEFAVSVPDYFRSRTNRTQMAATTRKMAATVKTSR